MPTDPDPVTAPSANAHAPIGVAVIGCGYWGPNLIRNFSSCKATRVVMICDRDRTRLVVVDHCPHTWIDMPLPTMAVEHPVMADARLHMMGFQIRPKLVAHILRRERLADRADIVLLTLDG